MARLNSGFVLSVFLQVPPAASARALRSYMLLGRQVLQLDLRIQADAADAVTVHAVMHSNAGIFTLTEQGSLDVFSTSKQLREK